MEEHRSARLNLYENSNPDNFRGLSIGQQRISIIVKMKNIIKL
jgi:hypothetical protein